MSLTDEQIDETLGAAYRKLIDTGYTGGMGSETWDRAAARAIEAAVLVAQSEQPQGNLAVSDVHGDTGRTA